MASLMDNDHLSSDVNANGAEHSPLRPPNTPISSEPNTPISEPRNRERNGRRVTINVELTKRRNKGKQIDIQFPRPFGKVCGKHARLFKSEVSVIVRKKITLQAKKWRDIEGLKPGTMAAVWRHLKIKFPEISDQDKDCAMSQVEGQYNNMCYRLSQIYRQKKPRPTHVSPEDWQWLISNLWTDENFLRDKETGEWPNAMEVWKATYQKADGTWSIPNGEETLEELYRVSETEREQISNAPIPIVKHFAQVLGRKPNHSRGVGIRAVNRVAEERIRFQAQIQDAEQRAQAAEQRAEAMEIQVQKLEEANTRMFEEQQAQREELNSQKRTVEEQGISVERLVEEKFQQQMTSYFRRIASNGVPFNLDNTS